MKWSAAGILAVLALAGATFQAPAQMGFAGLPDPYYVTNGDVIPTAWANYDTSAKTLSTQTINTSLKNLFLIAPGQSNYENEAPSAFTPVNPSKIDNLNVNDGAIYKAVDPLLGAANISGPGTTAGHPALRLADALITAGKFDRVIIAPLALGGTTIAQWAAGSLNNRIPAAIQRLSQKGFIGATNVTIVITWGQGESDCINGTAQAAYQASFATLKANAAAAGFTGKWFVAKQTFKGDVACAGIQAAQAAVVDNVTVFAGANADALVGNVCNGTNACRQGDLLHFSDNGSIAYATDATNGWKAALAASGAPF